MNVWTSAVQLAVRFAEGATGGASGAAGGGSDDTAFDANKVSPGIEGFLMTGLLALAVIGLGFVLVRTLRANSYREEVREQIAAEIAEQAEGAGGAGPAAAEQTGGAGASGAGASGAAPDRGEADGAAGSAAQK